MSKLLRSLSRKRSLPWDEAERVADIAGVPAERQDEFCNSLCDRVQLVWEQDWRASSSKPGPTLVKAARAARTLNEAVGSMNERERKRLDRLVSRDAHLSTEQCLRGATELFEIDELLQTVRLMDELFSIATGKTPPLIAGQARLSTQRGKKRGDVKNTAYNDFVLSLLSLTAEAAGMLKLDKNRYYDESGGPLVAALKRLRRYVPESVIPDGKLSLSTLQRIKKRHNETLAIASIFEGISPNQN